MIKKIVLFLSVVLIGVMVFYPKESFSFVDPRAVSSEKDHGTNPSKPWSGSCGSMSSACESGENCSCAGQSTCDQGTFYKTMQEYISGSENACWFCDVFYDDDASSTGISSSSGASASPATYGGGLFGAVNYLATTTYRELAKWFGAFMGMGILFFILFKVGKMLVSLQEVDLMQFLNDLLKPLGRGIIAAALLGLTMTNVSFEVFHGLTNPIFMAAAHMGNEIMKTSIGGVSYLQPGFNASSSGSSSGTGSSTTSISWSFASETCGNDAATALSSTDESSTALSKGQGKVLRCWMKQVSSSFISGIAIGSTFIKVGFKDILDDGLAMTVVGFVLWAGFWLLYLTFPLRILDAFIKFAFVMALMPLWIVLWVFPATRQYTKKAWEMFLSACLLLMILSLMISLTIMLVNNSIPQNAREGLLQCLRAGLDNAAVTWISFGSGAILNAIAFTFMGWALLKEAGPLANSFIGGGGNITTNIGNSVAGSAAQLGALSWAATKTGAKGVQWTAGKAGEGIGKGVAWAATPAAGARASKVNRFFDGLRDPKSLFRTRPDPYTVADLGKDTARMTAAAQGKVSTKVAKDVADIQRLATSGFAGDQVALQKMKNDAKSNTEREILENIMRSAEHKEAINPHDVQALTDERARQEMAARPLSEQIQLDKLNHDQADKKTDIADARADFARVKSRFEGQTNHDLPKYEAAALLTNETTYQAQRDALCSTKEQKDAMDQLHLDAKNNGWAIDSAAQATFVDNMSTAKAMESLPDTAAFERSDAAAVAWGRNANATTATENLQNDMTYVERALSTATDRAQFDSMIAAAEFSAGNEANMTRFSGQLWEARDHGEGQVNRAVQGFVSAYLQNNGVAPTDAKVLAEQVGETSKGGVMSGDDTAISSSFGALLK